jgi:AcrR family transcriptional regulator
MATATISPARADGRTARRLANRRRILDAALELAGEQLDFTAEDIAKRSGISVRSIYNHFSSVRDLVSGMYERGAEKLRPLLAYLPYPSDPLEERIRAWVAVWARIQEDIASIRWHALVAETEHPDRQPELDKLRAMHASEIERMFPEISTPQARRAVIAMTDSLAWRALRKHQGLSFEEASRVVEETIRRMAA